MCVCVQVFVGGWDDKVERCLFHRSLDTEIEKSPRSFISNWVKKLSPSSFQNRNLSRAQLTPSLPNMIEWYPINPSKKFAGERMSKFLHQLNESRLEARVPQLVEAGEDFDPRATSFRGEQFCVARLSTLFSKLKSRAEKFSFSHFSCVPYRCLMNEEACWSKPS